MMRTSFVALASGRPKRRSMLYDLHFACILIHINVYMRVSDKPRDACQVCRVDFWVFQAFTNSKHQFDVVYCCSFLTGSCEMLEFPIVSLSLGCKCARCCWVLMCLVDELGVRNVCATILLMCSFAFVYV